MSGRSWRVIVILFASSLLFLTSLISGDKNIQPSSLAMECPEDSGWQGNMSELANLTDKNGVIQDGQAKQSANDQSQFNIKFSLECFNVQRILRLASGHFTICYVININRQGHPRDVQVLFPDESIKKTLRVELGSEEVLSCIQNNWRFVGFDPDSAITVLLRWQHQKGYETMMIYSDKFSYMMRLIPTVYEDK
jgi:hypothetical protein